MVFSVMRAPRHLHLYCFILLVIIGKDFTSLRDDWLVSRGRNNKPDQLLQ